jgi:peroxiredoxin
VNRATAALALGLFAAVAGGCDSPRKETRTVLKPGDPAPAFRLPDHTGKTRTLEEFRGKRLVLWFFPKADTPG